MDAKINRVQTLMNQLIKSVRFKRILIISKGDELLEEFGKIHQDYYNLLDIVVGHRKF